MAKRNITVVNTNETNNRDIFVVDGNIYVLTGNAACIVNINEASKLEKSVAIGPDTDCDLARAFAEEAAAPRDITVVNANGRDIFVVDGDIYVLSGNAAMIVAFDKATEIEKNVAIGPDTDCDLARAFAEEAEAAKTTTESETEEPAESNDYHVAFDSYISFLKNLEGKEFCELVDYAASHKNYFPKFVKELSGCVNADDAYCSALIDLTRNLGEQLEAKAFKVVLNSSVDIDTRAEFFNALKVINK